jgi:hypothetical protein
MTFIQAPSSKLLNPSNPVLSTEHLLQQKLNEAAVKRLLIGGGTNAN